MRAADNDAAVGRLLALGDGVLNACLLYTSGADKADWGWLFFDKSPVPSGEVLDSASVLAVYCHAPYPLSLILGQIAGPSWNGPEWKITSGGVRGAGNLSCQIGITTENQTGAAQF